MCLQSWGRGDVFIMVGFEVRKVPPIAAAVIGITNGVNLPNKLLTDPVLAVAALNIICKRDENIRALNERSSSGVRARP